MASGTAESGSAETASEPVAADGYEPQIDARLRKTRGQVKTVDIVTRLVVLACILLVYLLAAAVLDHWIVPGGLGFAGRLLLFLGLVGGVAAYLLLAVLPLVLRRINPVYAALAIERNQPSLKNSLVNFLLMRRGRDQMAPVVYRALEEKAARDLSRVPTEGAVDRSSLVKSGYVLLAAVALFGLYMLLSPKDPLRSMGRVMVPWSDAAAPTRVTIEDVRPGDVRAFHEEQFTVSAVIHGIDENETADVYWTSDDGRVVEHPIRMHKPSGEYRYEAVVPDSASGLQQSGRYFVAAGDARSPTFQVNVLTAPAILVDQVEYHYPAYTGLGTSVVERQGDLQAIEGTRVVLTARANREIESAWLDFACDGRRDQPISVAGRRARVQFELRLGDNGNPEHDSYQILFVSADGYQNRRPIRHRIDVAADHPPQIRFLAPEQEEIDVPQNAAQELVVRAVDPDFALSSVRLRLEHGPQALVDEVMLEGEHAGPLVGKFVFRPSEFELGPGDEVEYWAEASDNRAPEAQLNRTTRRTMRIIASTGRPPSPQESERDDQAQGDEESQGEEGDAGEAQTPEDAEATDEDQPHDADAEESLEGEDSESADAKKPGEPSDQREPIDPEANPGDAFEKILEHRQQQEQASDQPSQEGGADPSRQQEEQADEGSDDQSPTDAESGEEGESQSQSGTSERDQEGAQSDTPGAGSGESGESGERGEQPGGDEPGRSGSDAGDTARQPSTRQGPGDRPSDRQPPKGAGAPDASQTKGKPTDRDSSQRPPEGEARPQASGGENQQRSGQGDRAQPSAGRERELPPDKQDSGLEAEGSDQSDPKGPPGAGESEGNTKGSPSTKEPSRPRNKRQSTPDTAGKRPPEEQPSAQSKSPHESDSQGGEDGERSGGGQQGGGQQADKPGTGSAGRNTAADEGGGSAAGKGQGPTSERPGDTSPSDGSSGGKKSPIPGTGRESPSGAERPGSGEQPGSGQSPRGTDKRRKDSPRPSGDASADNRQDRRPQADRSPGADDPQGGRPTDTPPSGSPGGEHSGEPGTPGQGPASGPGVPQGPRKPHQEVYDEEPGGEDPNLEYARKSTDLAIEHLKDQLAEKKADELLAQLGWTRDDAERFIRRWELMKKEAEGRGARAAQKRLDEALSSLGLRPRGTELSGDRTVEQRLERLRQSQRSRPPADILEQYRAFMEGTSKSPKSRGGR